MQLADKFDRLPSEILAMDARWYSLWVSYLEAKANKGKLNVKSAKLQNWVLIDADASKLQAEAKKADKAIESIGKGGFAKVKRLGKVASEFNLIPDSASRANSVLGTLSESFSGIAKVSDTATAGLGFVCCWGNCYGWGWCLSW